MNEFSKRAISGPLIILWTFSTIVYSSELFIATMALCLIIILVFEWPKLAKQYQSLFFIYPVMPFFLIIYLQTVGCASLNLLTFGASFLFDSSSYAFGKLFGKHKIVPSISPGKTVEGCLGGCLTLLITYSVYIKSGTAATTVSSLLNMRSFLIPVIISFLAFFGDLFESYLKRKSGLKDSGTLLPGHGGLLDRFDSILFVVVFVFLFRNYLITIVQG